MRPIEGEARLTERFYQVLSNAGSNPTRAVAEDRDSICLSVRIEEITTDSTSRYDLAVRTVKTLT
jgi:hypothetical protein